ncbi:MAG: hypothetical protein CL470_08520 [Acidimicrobiaceae bacterium]|nr:hypothetical protein [Acidimicrobiaceae bacterium]|tara:strand:- start:2003 stop:2791 length:789 start_codon:yes stop_codon:yes gene_type:complete
MNFHQINNKNLILTGGAGLLGSEFTIFLAKNGFDVFILDNNSNKISLLKKKLKSLKITNVYIFKIDITDYIKLKKIYQKIVKKYGDIKVLINNAAVDSMPKKNKKKKINFERKKIIHEFDISICGSLNCIQLLLETNKKLNKCNIVNIGSDLSVISPNQNLYDHLNFIKPISYSIIKHGIVGMTKYLSTLLAEKKIRVNCLSPASIENNQNKAFKNKLKKLIPLKRLSKKSEFNKLLFFLISEDSSYITGQNIVADGGRSII